MNNIQGDLGAQARANPAPANLEEVDEVIRSLKTQLFAESMRRADSCIICIEKFQPTDFIAEATCQAHHVFHSACLNEWLR